MKQTTKKPTEPARKGRRSSRDGLPRKLLCTVLARTRGAGEGRGVWFGFGSTPPPDDQTHGQRNRPCATRLGWALPAVAVSTRAGLLIAP